MDMAAKQVLAEPSQAAGACDDAGEHVQARTSHCALQKAVRSLPIAEAGAFNKQASICSGQGTTADSCS